MTKPRSKTVSYDHFVFDLKRVGYRLAALSCLLSQGADQAAYLAMTTEEHEGLALLLEDLSKTVTKLATRIDKGTLRIENPLDISLS